MSGQRPRVVLWDTLPTPYGVGQYNLLADRGRLDFEVWFSTRTDPDRSWVVDEATWRFRGEYVDDPGRSVRGARALIERCRRASPHLLVSPYGEAGYVAGHAIAKALDIKTCFVVQPTFDAWVTRSWWKELLKTLLFRSADAAQVPGADGRRYAGRYGFSEDRIFPVTMTTNVAQYSRRLSDEGRQAQRERMGVRGCVFLYVGRLWKPKGLLHLLEAYRRARIVNPDISLLLVGDGTDADEIRAAAAGIEAIVFWPFVQAPDLHTCYAAGDVFVFPTLGDPHGQVLEEAHAAGLPVITSDAVGDVHQRVANGRNGFVVPAGNVDALAQRMLDLAADRDLRGAMGARGAERASRWGHDVFADDLERLIRACVAAPPRPTFAARIVSALGRVVSAALTRFRPSPTAAPGAP
jgi:glycosyltransferase involved in cell wall biosynthesis